MSTKKVTPQAARALGALQAAYDRAAQAAEIALLRLRLCSTEIERDFGVRLTEGTRVMPDGTVYTPPAPEPAENDVEKLDARPTSSGPAGA